MRSNIHLQIASSQKRSLSSQKIERWKNLERIKSEGNGRSLSLCALSSSEWNKKKKELVRKVIVIQLGASLKQRLAGILWEGVISTCTRDNSS